MQRKLISTRRWTRHVRGLVRPLFALLGTACAWLCVPPAVAATGEIVLEAVKDNTIYSDSVLDGEGLSNGAGIYLFAGSTFQDGIRRGLVAFDLSDFELPDDAMITETALELDVTRNPPGAGATTISIHRITADWGEGASDAGDPGGNGAAAQSGDATWDHRFFDTDAWSSTGGDFLPDSSAAAEVDGLVTVSWSGSGVLEDVEHWLAHPEENVGWILVGDEMTSGNARRFASRENAASALRPRLRIRWNSPSTRHSADSDLNGAISLSELLRVIQFFNSGRFHCEAGTEDGYAPGAGVESCGAHASDYNPQNWIISLSELLRLIQFFNSNGYSQCPEGEDGFCVSSGAKEGP